MVGSITVIVLLRITDSRNQNVLVCYFPYRSHDRRWGSVGAPPLAKKHCITPIVRRQYESWERRIFHYVNKLMEQHFIACENWLNGHLVNRSM